MKVFAFIAFLFLSCSIYGQQIYKGLDYGMTPDEAKKAFKERRDEYINVDLGNNFRYRIYRQNFIYQNDKLTGITFAPKGYAMGMSYDAAKNYLIHTRQFFEELGYKTFIDTEWWNAPINFSRSWNKYGLVMEHPEKKTIVQLYPQTLNTGSGNTYSVSLLLMNHKTWMELYNKEQDFIEKKKEKSGF